MDARELYNYNPPALSDKEGTPAQKQTLLIISKVCGAGGIFPYSFKLLIYRTVYFCLFVYSSVFGDFCLLFITYQTIPFYHIKNIPFIIDASQCTYFITYLIF